MLLELMGSLSQAFDLIYWSNLSSLLVSQYCFLVWSPFGRETENLNFLGLFWSRQSVGVWQQKQTIILLSISSSHWCQGKHRRLLVRSKDYQVFGILVNFLFIALIQGHPIQGRTRYDLKVETNLQRRSNKIFYTKSLCLCKALRKQQTTTSIQSF